MISRRRLSSDMVGYGYAHVYDYIFEYKFVYNIYCFIRQGTAGMQLTLR